MMALWARWTAVGAILAVIMVMAEGAAARCEYRYVDHDFNSLTDPVWEQVCEREWDTPAIEPAQPVEPIQSWRPAPIDQSNLRIPPAGTRDCATERVYDYRANEWFDQIVCR